MARASKDAVLSAARTGGKMPDFQKWNSGSWTPGIGGASSNIGVQGITHGDAAYSTTTRKYYMATTTQKSAQTPSQISLFESNDALSWRLLRRVAPLNDVKLGWQYLSIFDKSGSDNAVVGNEFNIVVGKEPIDTTKSELYQFSVNLSGIPATPTPTPTPNPTRTPAGTTPDTTPGTQGKPSNYVGVFRAGAGVNYSNGSTFCYYRDMASFKCLTGLKSASNFPEKPELLGSLKPGGACSSSKCP